MLSCAMGLSTEGHDDGFVEGFTRTLRVSSVVLMLIVRHRFASRESSFCYLRELGGKPSLFLRSSWQAGDRKVLGSEGKRSHQ